MVCPYGVIGRQKDTRLAVKCDLCSDREVPACVEACPTHALIFSREEEFSEMLRKDAAARITRSYRARA
jgi:carbon-monoxide dehydrogenase iron sulfur subunit